MKRNLHIFFIFIILLFSIIPCSAYDFQHEEIWVHKGSFELGPGEKATIERYTVKVYRLDQEAVESSAVILVYKNDDFKKVYYMDAGPNAQRVYDNDLKIKVNGISSGKISIVLYGHEFEKVWVLSTPKISLSKGDMISDGAYAISLADLSSKEVNISVTFPSGKHENVFTLHDYKKYNNELMVRLVYIDKDRSKAFIETYRPGKPDVEVSLSSSSDIFEADEDISCMLRVTNNGTLPLRKVKVENRASEGIFNKQALSMGTLAPLQTVALTMGLDIPVAARGRSIFVTTEISGEDHSGNTYYATDTQDFFVGPYIHITKEIRGDNGLYGKTIVATHEQVRVSLKIKNMNDLPVALTVADSIPDSFVLQDTKKLEWKLQVAPHATEEITYIVSPRIPGNFTLGSAVAIWEDNGGVYEVTSASRQLMVNGSFVVADKVVNTEYAMNGEYITVILQVSNAGDQEVEVIMHDKVPTGADLVNGILDWSAKLAPGETSLQSYDIVFSEAGDYVLPELEVKYTDKQLKEITVYSEQVEMYIGKEVVSDGPEDFGVPSVVNGPQTSELTDLQAASFLVSSFIGIFCIVAVIPIVIFLLIRKVYM